MRTNRRVVLHQKQESELLARVRAGDEEAFASIFTALGEPLRGFVENYVDRATAEDVVQNVFLNVWRIRETWRPDGGVRAYLFAAARNQALSILRKRRTATRAAELCVAGDVRIMGRPERDPGGQCSAAELEMACHRAIHELPETDRVVVTLRWRYGMSHAEIAYVLRTTVAGVESSLSRSLRTLSERLDDHRLE